jgi:hypothetical protein
LSMVPPNPHTSSWSLLYPSVIPNGLTCCLLYVGSVGPPGDMETGAMLSSTQFQHLLSTHVRPRAKRLLVLITPVMQATTLHCLKWHDYWPSGCTSLLGQGCGCRGHGYHLCLPCQQSHGHLRREG